MRNIEKQLDKASKLGFGRKRRTSKADRQARVAAAHAARRKQRLPPSPSKADNDEERKQPSHPLSKADSDEDKSKQKGNFEKLVAETAELERTVDNLREKSRYWKAKTMELREKKKRLEEDMKRNEEEVQKRKREAEEEEREMSKKIEDLEMELEREKKLHKIEIAEHEATCVELEETYNNLRLQFDPIFERLRPFL
ncbi:hypothetical protein F5879DRAFT_920348 [Lentinula edodes]|uniref:uncharacterized protein n=1 Tax=Lentinula edodes TaxID=5353 RepID=UPI001E8CEAEA|nr:uncharacterized protein C8R40DRAFT_1171138 [Lentinula edodes]KAH7874519.1 hypothetical protein C8R40DRAFT_1171138 [Lentinula edodes]KAJ3906777.1 hypothetical protein F5879DRAFT_920348 [Lentinula edodes]